MRSWPHMYVYIYVSMYSHTWKQNNFWKVWSGTFSMILIWYTGSSPFFSLFCCTVMITNIKRSPNGHWLHRSSSTYLLIHKVLQGVSSQTNIPPLKFQPSQIARFPTTLPFEEVSCLQRYFEQLRRDQTSFWYGSHVCHDTVSYVVVTGRKRTILRF